MALNVWCPFHWFQGLFMLWKTSRLWQLTYSAWFHCCCFCLSHGQQTSSVTVGKPRQVMHHILDDSFNVVLSWEQVKCSLRGLSANFYKIWQPYRLILNPWICLSKHHEHPSYWIFLPDFTFFHFSHYILIWFSLLFFSCLLWKFGNNTGFQ